VINLRDGLEHEARSPSSEVSDLLHIALHPGITDSLLSGIKMTEFKRYLLSASFTPPFPEIHSLFIT
jgi:hypothetical protein